MKTITINGYSLNVGDNQNFHSIDYWDKVSKGDWEPWSFKVLDKFLHSQNILVDIGAWIGPLSLYASKLCKHVFAIEPDSAAFKMLEENIGLNNIKNITTIKCAISLDGLPINIYTPDSNNLFGQSTTNTIKHGTKGEEVNSATIQQLYTNLNIKDVGLFKMDIEGGEFDIIPAIIDFLRLQNTPILLACHYPLCQDDEKLDRLITSCNTYKFVLDKTFQKINDLSALLKPNLTEIILTNL